MCGVRLPRIIWAWFAVQWACAAGADGSLQILDSFEARPDWAMFASSAARGRLHSDFGVAGRGLRVDFDFRNERGSLVVRKWLKECLPPRYVLSLQWRAVNAPHRLELKWVDGQGRALAVAVRENPANDGQWSPMVFRGSEFQRVVAGSTFEPMCPRGIEIALVGGHGEVGSVWLDNLRLEARTAPPALDRTFQRAAAVPALAERTAWLAVDGRMDTAWRSPPGTRPLLNLDLTGHPEHGGIVIDWASEAYASDYDVWAYQRGRWSVAAEIRNANGGHDLVPIPDGDPRRVRVVPRCCDNGKGYGIAEIALLPAAPEDWRLAAYQGLADALPRGYFPRYFSREQSYWTVVGAADSPAEGLLSEDGALEVDERGFSLEPFVFDEAVGILTWNEGSTSRYFANAGLPIPTVKRRQAGWSLDITAAATAMPATLWLRYRLSNAASVTRRARLYLAVRPLQVNPPWQRLNMPGGIAPIRKLEAIGGAFAATLGDGRSRLLVSQPRPDAWGATSLPAGDVVEFLAQGRLPPAQSIVDPLGLASGALAFKVNLAPGATREVCIAIPLDVAPSELIHARSPLPAGGCSRFIQNAESAWGQRLDRYSVRVPESRVALRNTAKLALAQALINRDAPAVQPGSRNYARSWMRDGAVTADALLAAGFQREVRVFLDWYAGFVDARRGVPCCVDRRGADWTPEHDSHGEFIRAVAQYVRYTDDNAGLRRLWPQVTAAAARLEQLRAKRLTPAYASGEGSWVRGLLPESISHEGYAAHPVHAYWDDFWALSGLRDASFLATRIGDAQMAQRFLGVARAFERDLVLSIQGAMKRHRIDFLPGAAELGDFDPTATAIAVTIAELEDSLPAGALGRTFDRYLDEYRDPRSAGAMRSAYSPYELRISSALIRLGRRDDAWRVIDKMISGQRPDGWAQWGEVVWRNPREPGFIGDAPHSWIGAEYLQALNTVFAYTQHTSGKLVLAAGIPTKWLDDPLGVAVTGLPTEFGPLSYSLTADRPSRLRLSIPMRLARLPSAIEFRPPLSRPVQRATLNGSPAEFGADWVRIRELPAELVVEY